MIVLKFGGTSVRDAHWIDGALSIAHGQLQRAPVLVASAIHNTTDRLNSIAETARNGNLAAAKNGIEELRRFHDEAARELLTGKRLERAGAKLDELFRGILSLVKGVSLLREYSGRSSDALLASGELLASTLIAFRAEERGIPVTLLDSREFIRTDARFTRATPIYHVTNRLILERLVPEPGRLTVVQGFIGSTDTGVTTTLGRGGADATAAIIGAALHAEEIQLWTDLDGIMTSDPSIVEEARAIPEISMEEAAELAYFGVKVVHPSMIQSAVELGIPIRVKNIAAPTAPGTVIRSDVSGSGIRAITGKDRITLITVTSSRMLNAYGFLSRIFSIFEKHAVPVDLVATSEVSVSMTIEKNGGLEAIQQDLSEIGTVSVFDGMSIICLVGMHLWKDPFFIARVFESLVSIPIRMISLGSSDINLSLVVPEVELENAIRKLHRSLFE